MTADRKLIVSFHDLHPGSRAQCERFLAMMRELGVVRTTLLVVPRWHGAAPCDEDLGFAAWLRERAAEGHEICLHAYVHEVTEVTGNAVQRAMGKHYTAGEGEFYQGVAAQRCRSLCARETGVSLHHTVGKGGVVAGGRRRRTGVGGTGRRPVLLAGRPDP